MESMKYPALEECRAALERSLETLPDMEFQPVKINGLRIEPNNLSTLQIEFTQNSARPEPWLKPASFFILATKRPYSIEDLGQIGVHHTLGLVKTSKSKRAGDAFQETTVLASINPPLLQALQTCASWEVGVLSNAAKYMRIWESICQLLKNGPHTPHSACPILAEIAFGSSAGGQSQSIQVRC